MKILFFSFWGMVLYYFSFASCELNFAPLGDRVKSADAIFVGIVQSDDSAAAATNYDREAVVQVKKIFKGNPSDRIIVQYVSRKAGECSGDQLGSLSIGMGEERLFFVKKRNDKFFTSAEMGVDFIKFSHVKQDIAALPDAVKTASRPWWDFFGWTK